MSTTTVEIDTNLEVEVQTDKSETKLLPCVQCQRGCLVNRFKDPRRTLCSVCRSEGWSVTREGTLVQAGAVPPGAVFEFNEELETEVLTDKGETKEVPCSQCRRRCVVTLFATAEKVKCNTCRGVKRRERREQVLTQQAKSISAETLSQLENLADGIVNPQFKRVPLCPFDPDHHVELKYVCHNDNYGPRHYLGVDAKGLPRYEQQTGEVVNYQCNDCCVVISYSTMNPLPMRAQNEPRQLNHHGPSSLETMLGVRAA